MFSSLNQTARRDGAAQLKEFLNESNLADVTSDPLDWWKANSKRFPAVASVARDVLACPG